jgi:putative oxidoreductase
MLRKLIHTPDEPTLALIRFVLGVVFFAHGAQKVLGWFGGAGFSETMHFFTHGIGVPPFFAVLAILAEFLGGIGLIMGFLARIAAFSIAVDMAVAVALVHAPNGFFMNWFGNQRGEGFEFHLLAIAMALVVMVRGAGTFSLDRAWDQSLAAHPRGHLPQPAPMRP